MWVGMQYAKVRSKIKSNQVRMSTFINKGAMSAQKSPNSSKTKNYSRKKYLWLKHNPIKNVYFY